MEAIGELLESGQSGLIVVAVNKVGTDIEPLLAGAEKTMVVQTTWGDLDAEIENEIAKAQEERAARSRRRRTRDDHAHGQAATKGAHARPLFPLVIVVAAFMPEGIRSSLVTSVTFRLGLRRRHLHPGRGLRRRGPRRGPRTDRHPRARRRLADTHRGRLPTAASIRSTS